MYMGDNIFRQRKFFSLCTVWVNHVATKLQLSCLWCYHESPWCLKIPQKSLYLIKFGCKKSFKKLNKLKEKEKSLLYFPLFLVQGWHHHSFQQHIENTGHPKECKLMQQHRARFGLLCIVWTLTRRSMTPSLPRSHWWKPEES